MSPHEAIDWIDNATAGLNGDRAAHLRTMEAIRILRDAISPPPPAATTPPPAATPPAAS